MKTLSTLNWLQAWFASQTDGDWEHGETITIEALDNPGWSFRVCIAETALFDRAFEPVESHRSEHDWLVCRVQDGFFEAFCGPANLEEALESFRHWVNWEPE